jgi:hypothetical protein
MVSTGSHSPPWDTVVSRINGSRVHTGLTMMVMVMITTGQPIRGFISLHIHDTVRTVSQVRR